MTEELKNNGEIKVRDEKGRILPGAVLNPNGKPKGTRHIGPLLREKLKELVKDKNKTYAELFVERILTQAIVKGDYQFANLLINHVDGPATLGIDLTSDGERIGGTLTDEELEKIAAELSLRIKKKKTDIVD